MKSEKESNNSNGRGGKRDGAGRPKGSLDKGNATIRQMIAEALNEVGGVEYLTGIAKSHPAVFAGLVGKLMPIEVANPEGEAFKTDNVWRVELVRANANPS